VRLHSKRKHLQADSQLDVPPAERLYHPELKTVVPFQGVYLADINQPGLCQGIDHFFKGNGLTPVDIKVNGFPEMNAGEGQGKNNQADK
jgi:hypothetical protein